jgi:hypothetical protein
MLDKQISKNVKVKTALGNKDHKDHGKAKSLLKRFMDKFKKKKDEPKKSKSTPTSAADFRRSRKESVNENKKDAVYWQLVKNGNRPSEAKKILDKYYDKVSKMYKKASIQKKAEIISSLSGKNESVNERKFHSKKASDNYLGGLNSSKGDTEMFGDGKGKFYIWVKPKGKKEKYIDLPKSINDRSKADVFHKKIQKTMGESVEEGFGGDLKGEDKKKFEKARKANGEQLGYTLTGEGDIKESHTISFSKEEMSQLHNDGQIEKDGHTYVYTESVNEGFADKLTKKMKKHKGTKVTKLKLKGRGVYQKYDESDLPITTKKGKTIKAVHKTSGKEIVVVDTPSSRKKLKRMGFKVESVDEGQKRDSSNAYMKYYKTYETFAREVMNLAKTTTKLSGDRTDEKIILKNFKKYVIPFAGLMNSWDKGQQKNPHIDESVNEAITVAGYSELGKRGHNLPRAAKQFITALRKKDDREIEKYIDIIANLMKWMQTTLKNPRFNESVNETHHWSIEPSGVMAKINKIVQDKQHAKIGGVLVDMFSAGIMMQIYDKVNDKNKEQMNKGNIRQVQVVLNKVMKHNKITK